MTDRRDNLPTAQVSAQSTAQSTAHLPSTLTGADSVRIQAAVMAARSPQTRRAYASQWSAWVNWCASRGASPLPAAPLELAAYLAERAESVSTSQLFAWRKPLISVRPQGERRALTHHRRRARSAARARRVESWLKIGPGSSSSAQP